MALDLSRINAAKLKTRFISAVLIGPAFLYLVFIGSMLVHGILGLLAVLALWELYTLSQKTKAFPFFMLGLGTYILAGFGAFIMIFEEQGTYFTLLYLVLIWASDVGAYFFGKLIGGPKLIPRISPNKTWAGFVGSLLLPVFFVFGLNQFGFISPGFENYILALMIGLAGQAGDLIISACKRAAKTKDTGFLIPGHGGLLDRIDSMLLSSTIVFLYFN